MFNIESYVTPILLSYVDKYVRDFKPVDARVSLWGGGVTLHNLVLKADVLQQEVALPFTLVSGRIHELLIQVPWTKIMSEPIVVTINTIECILSLNPPPDDTPRQEAQSSRTQVVEAPPGYMQALVRKIVSNITIRVHSLIVKYVHDDIVMSLNVKHLSIDSAGPNWEPAFADIDQNQPAIRRLVRLDDLTLCLDKSDSDGKIRFFNEPLLYRCQLDLRVLTSLISAHTRRARSLSVQLSSSRLAWGVNNEQLVLLMRLLRERTPVEVKSPPPVVKPSNVQVTPMNAASSSSAETTRTESWSEWALSWLPTLDSEGVEETPASATPVPVTFTAHFDHVSLVLKIMESEATTRKRARSVLELTATDAVIKSSMCSPTFLRVKFGTRLITLSAHGKCPCGVLDASVNLDKPTIYLKKIESENEEPWSWVEEELIDEVVEAAVAIDEGFKGLAGTSETTEKPKVDKSEQDAQEEEVDEFWQKMAPVIYVEYNHDRSPSDASTNPCDNPPRDYEYSDWLENSSLKVSLRPISIDISTGLLHRFSVLKYALSDIPTVEEPEIPMRTLTVEECDALSENLPLRHTNIDISGLIIRVIPSNHTNDHTTKSPLVLYLQLPHASVSITSPLYPHRVCSAACQMLDDSGVIWQGARLHVSANIDSLQAGICSTEEDSPRVCARAKMQIVTHSLLNAAYFEGAERVLFGYTFTLREANVCGSAARLQAAYHIIQSLSNGNLTYSLRRTTLARDALSDEDSVAIDVTLEELSLRGYMTKNINTHFVTLNSAKATAFHSPIGGELKQAWLFSAPETPTNTPYLRTAMQWCKAPNPYCLEFVKVTLSSTALSMDPLLAAWLAYQPTLTPVTESGPQIPGVKSSSQNFLRRRFTPPSSGRGWSRPGSAAELVHIRPRSIASSSERSEMERRLTASADSANKCWWKGENLLKLHERLNRLLLSVEMGLIQIYVTPTSVTAIDCENVRDAMERYAITAHPVFVANLGQLTLHSSSVTRHLWEEVRYDRPTYHRRDPYYSVSFPWKTRLVDMSCYTLEVRAGTESSGSDKSASGLKSQLKASGETIPRPVLDLTTTTVTLSVVTKSSQTKSSDKPDTRPKHNENRTKYFTRGMNFKPSTINEFVRGPLRRSQNSPEPEPEPSPDPTDPATAAEAGPVESLGVYLHADTPPVKFRLDQDQVRTVAVTIHCFNHVVTLLRRPAVPPTRNITCCRSARRLFIKSLSELEGRQSLSEDSQSDNVSEQLINIFEANQPPELGTKLKTFFWFQWVVSRATLIVTLPEVKLAFDADDIITSVDFQNNYKQFKLKVASASVKHYRRTGSNEWVPGALGGRILEVREPVNVQEDNHFFTITVTEARIANLPELWKDLYKKLFEQNSGGDSIWEVYVTLAPLEVALQPDILDHAVSWLHEFTTQAFCSLNTEEIRLSHSNWPFLYAAAGGVRLLLVNVEETETTKDDTLVLQIGRITINPHPDNPILRQSINTAAESIWTSSGIGLEGMQYEVLMNQMSIKSAKLNQLVIEEVSESEILNGTGGENPALKWSQPVVSPIMTPILNPVDLSCILAPAMYSCIGIVNGPALELNIVSNCTVEVAVDQLGLIQSLTSSFQQVFRHKPETSIHHEVVTCPYDAFLGNQDAAEPHPTDSETTISEDAPKPTVEMNSNSTFDSGVETVKSQSTFDARRSVPIRKSVSIADADDTTNTSEYLEVFITMGVVCFALCVRDDGSPEVQQLKPPPSNFKVVSKPQLQVVVDENEEKKDDEKDSMSASKNLTETTGNADIGITILEQYENSLRVRANGKVGLLHAMLSQPNLYFLKRKEQKTFQVSVFNAELGLKHGIWYAPLITCNIGSVDPMTDIPPALLTMKIDCSTGCVPISGAIGHGLVQVDIERPVFFDVSMDRIRRIKGIMALIKKNTLKPEVNITENLEEPTPILHKMRSFMASNDIGRITIETSELGVRGSEGVLGLERSRLQSVLTARPDRLNTRVLLAAASASAGARPGRRHVVLQPATMGFNIDSSWETWRKLESGLSAQAPTVRVGLDIDQVILDVRPSDVLTLDKMQKLLKDATRMYDVASTPECSSSNTDNKNMKSSGASDMFSFLSRQYISSDTIDPTHHYYKDDLRSGAFKIVSSNQLPMTYQVTMYGNSVSWRYPHPRAITRLIAYPIPGLEVEVECTLDFYCPILNRWEPQMYFKLPLSDPREIRFSMLPHDLVFALIWRVRVSSDVQQEHPPFVFDSLKYLNRRQLGLPEKPIITIDNDEPSCNVTAEQLSGSLQVDSYFAPRLTPGARVTLRVAALEINAHNISPRLSRNADSDKLVGHYLTRPLVSSHRVLSLRLRDSTVHCVVAASTKLLINTHVSSDMLDSATGTMGQLIDEFRIQSSLCLSPERYVRARAGAVRFALHVPRVTTLRSLLRDWTYTFKSLHEGRSETRDTEIADVSDAVSELCGLVPLWVHNEIACGLRVGQEGTEEIITLNPGASLAYRWKSPTAPKKLRFALAYSTRKWYWSSGVPFIEHKSRVLINNGQADAGQMYVHVRVRDRGTHRDMHLSGRVVLANMLRQDLLFMVCARPSEKFRWAAISTGELQAESVGLSMVCDCDWETMLKVKFTSNDVGWSGEIPLKECRKENVPWLVKVPSDGEMPYTSVWCRIIHTDSDNSIMVITWPFYVFRSHLPLDVQISSVTEIQTPQPSDCQMPQIVQSARGRGAVTQLTAPGTTTAWHKLTFRYISDIACPVTRASVPLHYGVTVASVFESPATADSIEEIVNVLNQWLARSGEAANTNWPYSIVTSHWPGDWQPALFQPRCDIMVEYRAVQACGGCSLELQLSPVVLLANASPITLTLRGHDAAPLCLLEPGVAIAPPTVVLKKPFFISIELDHETFVSGQLRVCEREPGRYESPPQGHLALDRPAVFAVRCNQKVALLTMFYEIKEEINVLGITSTYMLINSLSTDICVSAIAVPNLTDTSNVTLQPNTLKVVQPTQDGSLNGCPLSRFWMSDRWRGDDVEELSMFLCLALPDTCPATTPVPVRLGAHPVRRAVALIDLHGRSIPVVVTQIRHEGRWIITVAPDPCPQFVVHNLTKTTLAVAQPVATETTLKSVEVVKECPGIKWWCVVKPSCVTHYSTPAHCQRFPPPTRATPPPLPLLTVGYCTGSASTSASVTDETGYDWCQPIAVADGEHLLQLSGGVTIKVRVRTHPHSTLIELLDVDQDDISASDIRRRLLGAFCEESSQCSDAKNNRNETLRTNVSSEQNVATTQERFKVAEAAPLLPVTTAVELSSQDPQKLQSNKKDTVKKVSNSDGIASTSKQDDSSRMNLSGTVQADNAEAYNNEQICALTAVRKDSTNYSETSYFMEAMSQKEWSDGSEVWPEKEQVRCVIESITVTVGASADALPLIAAHLQRTAVMVESDSRKTRTTMSVADVQVDNVHYDAKTYDFAVVATTKADVQVKERWPPLWGMFTDVLDTQSDDSSLLLRTCHDTWTALDCVHQELTEVELKLGSLGLYIEDAYVVALSQLNRQLSPPEADTPELSALAEIYDLQNPLRLRRLYLHPLHVTLTLHTAGRLYIALDESPLRLNVFQIQDMMTSPEQLTHALTVHYLSAAILGAGWVLGGLELLGAPGALVTRLSSARGGVRGVAAAAAGALLRSLVAAAGSLARNLDLLAGDDEHARRAAEARRSPPPNFIAGLVTGITNFAINILGAVGGIAHHPIVGVAVGETPSGASALRRSLVGAITKPLSATADLVAFAGHGLLTQTGWNPMPKPKAAALKFLSEAPYSGWRRDSVRWRFRLAALNTHFGFRVLVDGVPRNLFFTNKVLVIADPDTESVVEIINFKNCTLGAYRDDYLNLMVNLRSMLKPSTSRHANADYVRLQNNIAAMMRVARYTGINANVLRTLVLRPARDDSHALYAALLTALRRNSGYYFYLM